MAYEYIFASLPPLPADIGERVALAPHALYLMLKAEGGMACTLGGELLYAFDVRALERMRFGLNAGDPAVHSKRELEERAGLPFWLRTSLDASSREVEAYGFDRVWAAYYENLIEVAKECDCNFMKGWVVWEKGFRRVLADHRRSTVPFSGKGLPEAFGGAIERDQFKPIVETLVSLKESGNFVWRDMDTLIVRAKLKKAKELFELYSFDLDELLGYVVQYVTLKEYEYLKGAAKSLQ